MISLLTFVFLMSISGAYAASEDSWQDAIAEASQRYEIPEQWIRSVIATESGGKTGAVSAKGAMGLMQIMPNTWNNLSLSHDFDADPFNPRANIMAGTAYLKAMRDRFGYPALFAAYNAGPERYTSFLRTGKPLPSETQSYVHAVERRLADGKNSSGQEADAVHLSGAKSLPVASGTQLFFHLSTAETGIFSSRSRRGKRRANDLAFVFRNALSMACTDTFRTSCWHLCRACC